LFNYQPSSFWGGLHSENRMRCYAPHAVDSAQSALSISGLRGSRRGDARSLRSRAKKQSFFALL